MCYYSESFDLRAPKRQLVVKIKDRPLKCCPSISSRPPAILPHAGKVKLDESFGYATIDSANVLAADNEASSETYEYVRLNFAKLKIDSAVVTKSKNLTALL